jgi:hypothetical protein
MDGVQYCKLASLKGKVCSKRKCFRKHGWKEGEREKASSTYKGERLPHILLESWQAPPCSAPYTHSSHHGGFRFFC